MTQNSRGLRRLTPKLLQLRRHFRLDPKTTEALTRAATLADLSSGRRVFESTSSVLFSVVTVLNDKLDRGGRGRPRSDGRASAYPVKELLFDDLIPLKRRENEIKTFEAKQVGPSPSTGAQSESA